MISQLLHLIDSAIRRANPQSQSRSPFAWQSEFLFIQEKSKPAFSGIRRLARPRAIDQADSRPKGNQPA